MRQLKITPSITNRQEQSLEKYLQEIGKFTLLNTAEEIALAPRARNGDTQAIQKLTQSNLRFVVSVAKNYQNQGLALTDLINEGNIGLMKAVQRFDETRGFKFISFAVWWIRQSILQALAEQSRIVRLPLNKVGSINKINKAISHFEQQNQHNPSIADIAEALETNIEDIANLLQAKERHVSLDASVVDGEEEMTMMSMLSDENIPLPDDANIRESLTQDIGTVMKRLNDNQKEIITRFFGLDGSEPMTLDDIGEKMNLTRERVRQIKDKAIQRLRYSKPTAKRLQEYL